MNKRVTKIKATRDRIKQLHILSRSDAGTRFDRELDHLRDCIAWLDGNDPDKEQATPGIRDSLADFGEIVARILLTGDLSGLRDLADAAAKYRAHRGVIANEPDRWRWIIRVYCRDKRAYSVREIITELRRCGIVIDDIPAHRDADVRVRRYCKELCIRISGRPGRPKKP